ncbi:hypothetical protein DW624_RS00665 [Enterococcus hirae]
MNNRHRRVKKLRGQQLKRKGSPVTSLDKVMMNFANAIKKVSDSVVNVTLLMKGK